MAISKSVQFSQGDPAAQAYDIQRAQQLAQLLQQQSMQPIESSMPNAPISWTQGLAKMMESYGAKQADNKVRGLLAQKGDQAQQRQQGLIDALTGTKQVGGVDENNPGFDTQALRAQPGEQPYLNRDKLVAALQGSNPEDTTPALSQLLFQRAQAPQGFTGTLGPDQTAFANGQPVATGLPKEQDLEHVSRQLNERQAQEGTFNRKTGEYKWGAAHLSRDPSAFASGAQGDLTPEALHDAIIDVIADPKRMAQYAGGMGGQRIRTAINNGKSEYLKGLGLSEQEVIKQQAVAQGQIKSIKDLIPMQNALQSYETVARANGDRALELIGKVNKSGMPVLNSALRLGAQQTGNPDAAELIQVLQNYQTEVARIIANPRLVGQLTDTARKEIEGVVPANMTPAQAYRVINRLNFEFDLRNKGISNAIETGQGQLNPTNAPQPATADAVPKVVKFEDLP